MSSITDNASDTIAVGVDSKKILFWGCFIVLVSSAFGFVFRSFLMADWGIQFGLSKTQQGEIFGVSFWPFGISIVFFSLIIDKVGYKKSMIFAFICHTLSVIITIMANGYWMLYFGTLLFALGNGAAEAVVNPVVATMYPKDKTKWLNILHAGWPTGLVISGLLAITMLHFHLRWEIIIGFIMVPVIVYGVIIAKRSFPVNERVKAGVSYLEMLKEVGVLGILIVVSLCAFQLGNLFDWSYTCSIIIILIIVAAFAFFVRTLGHPLFIMLLLLMIPLATTELGTDSWISDLMTPEMAKIGLQGGWVLVYTSVIMAILRFYSGPIVHKFAPLGLLAVSAVIACFGLEFLSYSAGFIIIVAATIYALGKTFFWGTMLGVVSEQFPRGGALTLNFTSAVGQVGVGVIGAVFLGTIQDKQLDKNLANYDIKNHTELNSTYITQQKKSIFGKYQAIDDGKLAKAPSVIIKTIADVQNYAKKDALRIVGILPGIVLLFYLGFIVYFKRKGGYKPVVLKGSSPNTS
ncbi:MAG: transporter [Mucilaginibacter sp.]|nr:transporter [Mucilaginibacter sp.]